MGIEGKQLEFWANAADEIVVRRTNLFSPRTILKDVEVCARYILEPYELSHTIRDKVMKKFIGFAQEALECAPKIKNDLWKVLFHALRMMANEKEDNFDAVTAAGNKVRMGVRGCDNAYETLYRWGERVVTPYDLPAFFRIGFINQSGACGTIKWDRMEIQPQDDGRQSDQFIFLQERKGLEFHIPTSREGAMSCYYNGMSILAKRGHNPFDRSKKDQARRPAPAAVIERTPFLPLG